MKNFTAKTTAGVRADEDDVLLIEVQPARHRADRLHDALRRAVDVQLAILPVRHGGAWLQRLMAGIRRDERLVEHERRALESGVEIPDRPFVRGRADRQPALRVLGGFSIRPFQLFDPGRLL